MPACDYRLQGRAAAEGEDEALIAEAPLLMLSNEEQLQLELREAFVTRARELGISEAAMEDALSHDPGIASRSGAAGEIRVLQWNILADGLARDGFIVRDVLSGAADGEFEYEKVVLEMAMVHASGALDKSAAKAEFFSERSKRNLEAVVDWSLRFSMIMMYTLKAKADIIVMQEVDHMLEMQQTLGRMGYACGEEGKVYVPAHAAMEGHGAQRDASAFFRHLKSTGVAFVPKTNSNCRKFGLKDRQDADDDGVAVFWRRDALELVSLDFLVFDDPKRNQGAVRVTLKRKKDGTDFAVIGAHLSSGSGNEDEKARLKECIAPSLDAKGERRGPSLGEWIDASAKMAPTIVCADTNSSPDTGLVEHQGQTLNTLQALLSCRAGVRSVWPSSLARDGAPKQCPAPVTENKMRGPHSGQPKKIGEHACALVDQMLYTTETTFVRHANRVLQYRSEGDARRDLLPTLRHPSDHCPVLCDFVLPIEVNNVWAQNTHTPKHTPLEESLLLARQQLADENRLITLRYVDWSMCMSMSEFHDGMMACAHGALTTVEGESVGALLPAQPATTTTVSKESASRGEDETFTVGDKVRVKASVGNPRTGWASVKPGEVGTITAVDGTNLRIDFPHQSGWNSHADDMENVSLLEQQLKARLQFDDAGAWLSAEHVVRVPGSEDTVDVELRLRSSPDRISNSSSAGKPVVVTVFIRCKAPKAESSEAPQRLGAYAGCAPGLRLVVPCPGDNAAKSRMGTVVELSGTAGYTFQVDNAETVEVLSLWVADGITVAPPQQQYRPNQHLLVEYDGALMEAKVEACAMDPLKPSRHALRLESDEAAKPVLMDLNPYNHCVRRLDSAATTMVAYLSFVQGLLHDGQRVEDAITGKQLLIDEQLVFIETQTGETATDTGISGVQQPEWMNASDMASVSRILLKPSPKRAHGTHEAHSILIRAKPGTGKSWSMLQLQYMLAKELVSQADAGADAGANTDGVRLVPLLVVVQQLVVFLVEQAQAGSRDSSVVTSGDSGGNLLVDYIRWKFDERPGERDMLLQAYDMRALIVLLDGIDEAAGFKHHIEDFLVNELVPMGMRTVATSRPEGVRLQLYQKRFVIMNLKELSDEQQRTMISAQLGDDEQFRKLSGFSKLRKDHDHIYQEAFPEQRSRDEIEHFTVPDRFKTDAGSFDPAMRQHIQGGARVVAAIREDAPLNSASHLKLDKLMRRDGFLLQLNEDSSAVPAVKEIRSVASRLANLVEKRKDKGIRITPEALWRQILARTDEIYVVADVMSEVFPAVAKQLVRDSNMKETALHIGPLKDPVRVHEKAVDDYADRFPEEHPEACVADIVRSKVVCETSSQMLEFVTRLREGFAAEHNGKEARLELIRCKNKFQPLAPTHFRNLLCNVRLSYDGSSFFAEIQVHLEAIYAHQESCPNAHPDYEYFRSKMGEKEQDAMLERTMLFFEEASGIPVLLSMLVLVFGDAACHDGRMQLPSSLQELYTMAMDAALRARFSVAYNDDLEKARHALRRIAVYNQLRTQRVFRASDVASCLGPNSLELAIWRRLEADIVGIPLVKTLQVGGGYGAEYQFKHLSFQEALFAGELLAGNAREFWSAGLLKCVKDAFNANAFRIMGAEAVDSVVAQLSDLRSDENTADVEGESPCCCGR